MHGVGRRRVLVRATAGARTCDEPEPEWRCVSCVWAILQVASRACVLTHDGALCVRVLCLICRQARIKKIMQLDDDVGKVAAAVPLLVCIHLKPTAATHAMLGVPTSSHSTFTHSLLHCLASLSDVA